MSNELGDLMRAEFELEDLQQLVVEYSREINRYREALRWIDENAGSYLSVRARCRRELGTEHD
jgi:hypothetical protein